MMVHVELAVLEMIVAAQDRNVKQEKEIVTRANAKMGLNVEQTIV